MKQRILLTALISLLVAVGCVPTPDEEIVSHKDTRELVELALQPPEAEDAPSFEPPASLHIERACNISRADIAVSIDADVVLPETNRIPLVHIRKGTFSEDFLRRVMQVIGNGSRAIEVFPKSYYQNIAQHLMDMRDRGELDKYDSVEEINRAIIEVLAEGDSMPDAPVFSDRDPVTEPDIADPAFGAFFSSYCGISEDGSIFHMCMHSSKLSYFRDIHDATPFENTYNFRNALTTAQPMIDRGMIEVKYPARTIADAEEEARRVMEALWLSEDFALMHARLAPIFQYAEHAQKYGCKAAYEFLFTRKVNGVNVTYTDDLASNGADWDAPEGGFAPEWRYERVRLYLDDRGVLAFYCDGEPYEILEIPRTSVRILSLDDAIARFEQTVGLTYADDMQYSRKPDASIRITEIRLGLTRVLEQNVSNQAYLVPSWTFFGVKQLRDNAYIPGWEGEGYDGTGAVLVINAIDGSVIDPQKGY